MTAPHIQSPPLPPLREGERMDRKTFHERYERMPRNAKAELIGGVVYMPSPLRVDHGDPHSEVIGWLTVYKAATPGVRVSDNSTVFLADHSEPQPDASLRVLPEYGGQAKQTPDGHLEGAPELLVEVAVSNENYDLRTKRQDYEALGVLEYIVVLVRQERIVWFVRRGSGFIELTPGNDGIYRSEVFGGLWLDHAALFRLDTGRLLAVLQKGLQAPDHAKLVERLRQQAERSASGDAK